MAQNDIHVPPEVQHVINERIKIWSELDAAQSRAGQINQLAQKLGNTNGQISEVTAPFTSTNNPSDEIEAVVAAMNKQMKSISDFEQEITNTRSQIDSIRTHAKNMIIGIVVAAVVVLAIIFFVILK